MANIRGTHSSPGVYTQITDLSYAAKTLGITTLGLVGETKKGPAFEKIPIKDWTEFKEYFGGTSAEKFKGSSYPKYELPYIAKSYLSASDQLYVCRVLGLSGYNAGPAFIITANDKNNATKQHVVAVLRSRGKYQKYAADFDPCTPATADQYDSLVFDCDSVEISQYSGMSVSGSCSATGSLEAMSALSATNHGRFNITCKKDSQIIYEAAVSLNPNEKDYIYNVLGSNATEGSAPVFVEELYDLYLEDLILGGISEKIIGSDSTSKTAAQKGNAISVKAVTNTIADFLTVPSENLSKSNFGKSYIATAAGDTTTNYYYDENGTKRAFVKGGIYNVSEHVKADGTKEYAYFAVSTSGSLGHLPEAGSVNAVKVKSANKFVCLAHGESTDVVYADRMNDYYESFRCATTPWIVSEIKGSGTQLQVKKLFRFHTISDGTSANSLVKISIANIKPDEGTFDVQIRDFNDSDLSPIVLESYKNCTMVPGTKGYIGLKIGTLDGSYALKSKHVMVEVIENDITATCVPAGFLGYPTRDYSSVNANLIAPTFKYNTNYNEDIKDKKQYFGLSDLTGVDVDMLYYKGAAAYTEKYTAGYTPSFHLDSTLSDAVKAMATGSTINVTIDGDSDTTGVKWDTVSYEVPSGYTKRAVIGTEAQMAGSMYENINLRKFTVYPCGGFDGWDIYRQSRTTGDEYKANKYKGTIINGHGNTFSAVSNADVLGLDGRCITSDYYAYLAGAKQFEIPEHTKINLFATPGIDYVNAKLLSNEILTMIEEKRADSLYVMTTPDKPFGASDAREDMFTSAEAVANREDSGIDSYYAATYYPWIQYYDADNSIYVNIPATKDVLRNMANIDNKRYPWYAPAGIERGVVECEKMRYFTRLEDEDTLYDGLINPLKKFSSDGVKIWGNKTMYTGDTPMNRINVVRLVLYVRELIKQAATKLIFDPNDITLKKQFEGILDPILSQVQNDRGITAYRLKVEQTPEMMDAHELNATVFIKPTPALEYIQINFVVTPQGVEFTE